MKKLSKEIKKVLSFNWSSRLKLWAEGEKLRAEGKKLRAEGNKLWAEGNKLMAEGNKLWAEGDKLWAETILELVGNIKLEWKNYNSKKNDYECHLETGDVFKP
jgi:hypothetical protein